MKKIGIYLKTNAHELVSYTGLALCLILFFIFNERKLSYNIGVVIQTAAPYALISLGGLFIYSMGFMDVSIGQQVGVFTILMIMFSNSMTNPVLGLVIGFAVVLILALLFGALNGAVAVWLGLPSIVTSLFLMFVLGGVQYLLIERTGTNSVSLGFSLRPADRNLYTLILAIVIIAVQLIAYYSFNFTKLGKYTRSIGSNETATAQSGVSTMKWKVVAYMFLGFTVALASLVVLSRTGSAGKGSGSGYAMDVMICLILGGMPLSGGMKARAKSALIGTFTYVLLTNDLTTMGVSLNLINFVKAIIFLIVILLTSRKKYGVMPR